MRFIQKTLLSLGLLLATSVNLFGQEKKTSYAAELVATGGNKQVGGALSGMRLHGIGQKNRFKIGYGLRFTSYFGNDQEYITAPADLTSGKTGLTVIFTENILENLDTLTLPNAQVNLLNAAVFLEYAITPRLDAGFNIDVIGFSFGGTQTGRFAARQSDEPTIHHSQQSAQPTGFNLLLTSDNDLGSLNSEFFVRYRFWDKLAIKAGYSFLFTEYTTDRKLTYANDRFRNKAGMLMVGVTYWPFK